MSGKEKLMIDLYLGPYPKITERTLNITSVLHNFKSFIKQVYEKGCIHKFNKKRDQTIYLRADLGQRLEKLLTFNKKMRLPFNKRQNLFFCKIEML